MIFGKEKRYMKRTIVSITLAILFGFIIYKDAISWDDGVTHKDFSKYAAESSMLSKEKGNYLKNLGLNKGLDDEKLEWSGKKLSIKDWLAKGAELEDAGNIAQLAVGYGRSFNHFHNPLKPWENAGLDDWIILPPFHVTGESSLIWAQDGTKQATYIDIEGDWSWQKVREYYYTALTGEDSTGAVVAPDQAKKNEYFARTFKGLGHQMHLLQDTAVPDHVRNDAHPEDSMFGKSPFNGSAYFESWAKEKGIFLRCLLEKHSSLPPDILSKCQQYGINEGVNIEYYFPSVSFNVSYNGLAPTTQLFDAEEYNGTNPSISLTQGLSEYTNANFFSEDTIFAAERYSVDNGHYFPYPKITSTDLQNYLAGTKPEETVVGEDGDTDTGIWISKNTDGENIKHFVRTGKLTKWYYNIFGEGSLFYSSFYRDEKCHEDYAEKLIPRAVGYSAGLLDYFFRGSIEITLPNGGIYSLTNNPDAGFTRITLLAKNTTSNGDEITDGSIELVVRYKIAQEDPFQSYPVQTTNDFTYTVIPVSNNIRFIPKDIPVELIFDAVQNTIIPLNATDVYLQIVYKGKLGNEEGAVAVGFKDISEPTPVDLFNNMDKVCINGKWYIAGSDEALSQVNPLAQDVYAHDIQDAYLKISSINNPVDASPTDFTFYIPLIKAGTLYRAFVLSDYGDNTFSSSDYAPIVKTDERDIFDHTNAINKVTKSGSAIKNQVDYQVEDQAECDQIGTTAPCDIRYYPLFYSFRGKNIWGPAGFIVDNPKYPEDASCPWDLLN
jgi:hypothetical protein